MVKNFSVKKGNVENFSFSYKIPEYLEHSYSIGNYSALVYFLRFQYLFRDDCDSIRLMELPIYIQTKTPKLKVNIDEIPSSYEWNPTVQQENIIPIDQEFVYNAGYPLEKYRLEFDKHRLDVNSIQYFNKMNSGYMTKNKNDETHNN